MLNVLINKASAFLAFTVIICGLFAIKDMTATTIYVSKEGSDKNTGFGPNSPRLTVNEALNDASDGDSIIVGNDSPAVIHKRPKEKTAVESLLTDYINLTCKLRIEQAEARSYLIAGSIIIIMILVAMLLLNIAQSLNSRLTTKFIILLILVILAEIIVILVLI